MKEVLCKERFGTWCIPGRKLIISNNLALSIEKKGYLEILRDIPYEKHFTSKVISKKKVKEVIDNAEHWLRELPDYALNGYKKELKKELDLE